MYIYLFLSRYSNLKEDIKELKKRKNLMKIVLPIKVKVIIYKLKLLKEEELKKLKLFQMILIQKLLD